MLLTDRQNVETYCEYLLVVLYTHRQISELIVLLTDRQNVLPNCEYLLVVLLTDRQNRCVTDSLISAILM